MLSNDELANGMPFILRLWDGAGAPFHWIETLRGDVARQWYQIYWASDWEALRSQGPATFRNRASDADVARARSYGKRSVVIHTTAVRAEEIGTASARGPAEVV